MFTPSTPGRVGVNAQRLRARSRNHRLLQRRSRAVFALCLNYLSRRSCAKADRRLTKSSKRWCAAFTLPKLRDPESIRGFTLLELLIVIGIIGVLLVLLAPAFTAIKSATDISTPAYMIKSVLETARTYAKANNTYVFVGFVEVDSSVDPSVSPQVTNGATPYGRVAVAVVASKDGNRHFDYRTSDQGSDWTANYADPTKTEYRGGHLLAVGKLQRFENLHFTPVDFGSWTPTDHPGSNMARYQPTGPPYILGNAASSSVTPFSWPLGSPLDPLACQYYFNRVIYFDPTGSARIATSNNANAIVQVMEIDLQPTHGTVIPALPTDQDVGNQAAIQIVPMSGVVRAYRP